MEPTYSNGDWIVVEKRNYLPKYWIPDRYDVVVIYDGESDDSLSKRVIGIPGDTIEIKHGVLFVNDKKHNDPFSTNENIIVYLDSERELFHNMYVDKITVPEGYVWVIGDNRKISWYGLLPVKDIEGLIIL
jgi:signal peptidase I